MKSRFIKATHFYFTYQSHITVIIDIYQKTQIERYLDTETKYLLKPRVLVLQMIRHIFIVYL